VVDPDVGLPVPRRESPERVFRERLGTQMKTMVEDQVKVKILGPTFFGPGRSG
jgi:hypothetical protein